MEGDTLMADTALTVQNAAIALAAGDPLHLWPYRKRINLPIPTANLTDFPEKVPIIADAAIGAHCLASGYDIRFTAADGTTLLSYERESWSGGGGSAVTAIFWVKTDVATAGTYIWCYYGNAAASDGEDAEAVWDDDYKAVYHMKDATTSTILDSTGNDNDGTKKAANEPIEATGKIGKGQSFDGANDYINNSIASPAAPVTISVWIKSGKSAANQHIGWLWDNGYIVYLAGTGGQIAAYNGATYITVYSGDALDGAWHKVTRVDNGPGNSFLFYVDGQLTYTGTSSVSYGAAKGYWGSDYACTDTFAGIMDEVRVSSSARSAAWIAYEYANMNPADGGLTWGAEEDVSLDLVSAYVAGPSWLEFIGIIRDISINGPNITYKCEVSASGITTSDSTLAVRNCAFVHAVSDLSLINLDAATTLTVQAAAVAHAAGNVTLVPGTNTNLYDENDAMETPLEADAINPHWTEVNATFSSAGDAGGGSTYVGLLVRGAGTGEAYVHSAHVADLVIGTAYGMTFDYQLAIGSYAGTAKIYQMFQGVLTAIAQTSLSSPNWAAKSIPFTALSTGPLQMRISFGNRAVEGDEIRIDDIAITTP
jgi:hypothetical protein